MKISKASPDTMLQMRLRLVVKKGFFDRPRIKRMIDNANRIGLDKSASKIWEASKRAVGRAPKRTKKWEKASGANSLRLLRGGLYRDLTNESGGQPRPAGEPVKSWAPKRLLYKSLKYYYDSSTKSAVIGPAFIPWLVQLHERGGSLALRAYVVGQQQARLARLQQGRGKISVDRSGRPRAGALIWSRNPVKNWTNFGMRRTAKYPARPFMGSAAVNKAKTKIASYFRDTIRGPGI